MIAPNRAVVRDTIAPKVSAAATRSWPSGMHRRPPACGVGGGDRYEDGEAERSADLAGGVKQPARQPAPVGPDFRSAAFVQALLRHGLIDEYRVVIQPVAFGAGLLLFKDMPAALRLSLVEARRFGTGAVGHVYRPRRS
jgi:hypothetical protein